MKPPLLSPPFFVWLVLIVFLAFPSCLQAEPGSWLISAKNFSRSAHADLACQDCHSAQASADHPDASNFGAQTPSAFSLELCLQCHMDVGDDLAQNKHAGRTITGKDYTNCVRCHNPHVARSAQTPVRTAPFDESTQKCLTCHDREAARGLEPALCLACHEPLTDPTHSSLACLDCHSKATNSVQHLEQGNVNCLTCHTRHSENKIHDAHTRVLCVSCHGENVTPQKQGNLIGFTLTGEANPHKLSVASDESSCVRCHDGNARFNGEALAADMILPPKSILCAGCHAAPLRLEDTPSRLGFGVFLIGFLVLIGMWFTLPKDDPKAPKLPIHEHHTHKSIWQRLAALTLDILGQRKLWQENRLRWFVHALIFFPFLIRFTYGLIATLGAWLTPESAWPWAMLAKDQPFTAFLHDITGLCLVAGLIGAGVLWRQRQRKTAALMSMPKPDWFAIDALLAISVTGFILEGARIALTAHPEGSSYAFLGSLFAYGWQLLGTDLLASLYGYLWYLHAILCAATIALLPFTQLRHIVTAPLLLCLQQFKALRATKQEPQEKQSKE